MMLMNSAFNRIVGINMVTLLLLTVGLRLINRGAEASLAFGLEVAALIAFMTFINLGFAVFSDTSEEKRAHWLSFFLVLLIGFGICGMGMSIRL